MWYKLVWETIVKRPYIPVIMILFIIVGGMGINVARLNGNIAELEAELAKKTAVVEVSKQNEKNCINANGLLEIEINTLNGAIDSLQFQLEDERTTTQHWKEMYDKKPKVITEIKEVPVIKYVERGVVVDEESSKKYIGFINTLFDGSNR